MKPTIHFVQDSELTTLKTWLEQYLPHSFKICFTIREMLQGRWNGTRFCTLGWPNILAVTETTVSKDCPIYDCYTDQMSSGVFAPRPGDLETLLTWPGVLDWSRPIEFKGVSHPNTPVIQRVALAKGGHCRVYGNVLLEATPESLPPLPAPEGFYLADLDPDLHTEYVTSTWPHSDRTSHIYIRALIQRFPSVGLFDKNGECIGLEMGKDHGTIGMLHVREEYRGRGFGKMITSQLAQKYFGAGLPVLATVIKNNTSSVRMHTSCGFTEVCDVDWINYEPSTSQKD